MGEGSALLNKMVEEIEVASVGVGGAKNFFEDKAARTKLVWIAFIFGVTKSANTK